MYIYGDVYLNRHQEFAASGKLRFYFALCLWVQNKEGKKKKTNSITNCSEWESALWFKTLLKFPSMQDPSLHSLPHIVKKLQIKRIHWARRDSLMKPKDSLCIYQSCHAFVRSVRHYNLCICWSLWFCLSLFLQHLCAKEIPDDAPKSLT